MTGAPAVKRGRRGVRMSSSSRAVLYLVLVLFAAGYLLPMYVMVVTSSKDFAEVSLATMWELPRQFSLDSFSRAWFGSREQGYTGLNDKFFNSVQLVIPAATLSSLLGSLNGYVFAKWKFRYSNLLFMLFIFGMFIPYQSVLIPLVQVLMSVGLYGTIPGLVLVHVIYGIPITTLIFRNYYAAIPTDLIEAARIDGAGFYGIYRRVLMPLSIPGFVVALIWQFTSIWNDFLFAVVITQNPAVQPITVGLNNLAGSYIVEWNVQMAGALLAALPTLVVYIILGRYFLRGLLAGSLKG
ncbi:MAG: carbohydrate ABC transporter permease [Bacillota bacterium]